MKITISTFFPSCLPYISDHFSPMYLVFNLNSNNMLTVAVIFLPCPYPSAWKYSDVVSRNFVSISAGSER